MTEINRRSFLRQTAVGAAALSAVPLDAATKPKALPTAKGASRPTLIKGADLLTMDPKLGELAGTDVLIADGKIAAIGKALAVGDAEVIDAKDMILMPGMVNGHSHLWMSVDAGSTVKIDYAGYGKYRDWKIRTVVALAPEDVYLGCLLGGLQAIDSGVTTILDEPHGQHTLALAEAAAMGTRDSGVSGWCAFQMGVNADYGPGDTVSRAEATARYITPAEERHWKIAETLQKKIFSDTSSPMQMSLAPAIINNLPLAGMKAEVTRAQSMGIKLIACSLSVTASGPFGKDPVAPPGHLRTRGSGVIDLYEAGLLGPYLHVTHGTGFDAEELKMLSDNGVMMCSTSMGEIMYTAKGWGAPAHGRAREAGIAVGIGMDTPQAVIHDYFEHVRAAQWSLYLEPEGRKIVQHYTSTDALDFATGMGARALGLGDVTGTITVGKRADLVLLRTDRIGFAMQGSLADRVVAFAALQDIDSVWVTGKARKRNGRMLGVDWANLKAQLAKAQARFRPLAATVKIV